MRVVGSLGQYVMGCQVGSKGTKDGDVVVPRQSRESPRAARESLIGGSRVLKWGGYSG